jgi:hypothetical protein
MGIEAARLTRIHPGHRLPGVVRGVALAAGGEAVRWWQARHDRMIRCRVRPAHLPQGPGPGPPAGQFTTIACGDDRGRRHGYELADTAAELDIGEGPRKGQTVALSGRSAAAFPHAMAPGRSTR